MPSRFEVLKTTNAHAPWCIVERTNTSRVLRGWLDRQLDADELVKTLNQFTQELERAVRERDVLRNLLWESPRNYHES